MKKLVIFQNYYTEYRARLFSELAKTFKLTVVYFHRPEDEGRKWTMPKASELDFSVVSLSYKKIGPIIWPTNFSQITSVLTSDSLVIFLDNLPTNLATLWIMLRTKKLTPRSQRTLWVEHIPATGKDSSLKSSYKSTVTWLLARFTPQIIAFSAMTEDYLKSIKLPYYGQTIHRTIQAGFTKAEIKKYSTLDHEPHSGIVFGFLGYFSERKGIRHLLKAISFYQSNNARFIFVGDGPLRMDLEKAAMKDPRITVYPYATSETEKSLRFAEMDVHLVPSEKDPWCLVVNEAATRGVPSLVSPHVGAKELMKEISDDFELFDTDPLSIAHAFHDLELVKRTKPLRWKKIVEKTKLVAKEWSVEQAAEMIRSICDYQ